MNSRSLTSASVYLGGMFAWMLSVPLFGPVWLSLAPASPWGGTVPVHLFLGAHALGLIASGLAADMWRGWRDAGLRCAPAASAALTAAVALRPEAAVVAFPLMGVAAAWGITAWAPVFRALVPVRRRARVFAWVPITANGVKYALSLGIGHLAPSVLLLLAVLPLLAAAACGGPLARVPAPGAAGGPSTPLPPAALRALWILAPFLLMIYTVAGLTYAAMTPMLLNVLHTHADLSLLSYVASVGPLAVLADRTSLRALALLGPLVSSAAFVIFAFAPTTGGALMTQLLMGAGYAALDLVTWLALLEIAPPENAASLFGIGLNTNVLPILISAGLQSTVPALARLGPNTLAAGLTFLMLLAVVMIRGSSVLQRAPEGTAAPEPSTPREPAAPHAPSTALAAATPPAATAPRATVGEHVDAAGGTLAVAMDADPIDAAASGPRPDASALAPPASATRARGVAIRGGARPSPADLSERLAHLASPALTPRELQVALLAIQGRTVAEIAAELFVSENTVKTHLASVYRKTQTRGRADLTARAMGLAAPGDGPLGER